jgi:hypothetical protein
MRPRARVVLAVVAGALIAPAPVSSSSAQFEPDPVVVTTANIHRTMPRRQARADIARAARAGDVVLTQENRRRRAGDLAPNGWTAYAPRHPSACRENVVYWDPGRFRRVVERRVVLYPRRTFPASRRCASVVVLEDRRSGIVVPVVSVHMIPHVERAGRPRRLPTRIRIYHRTLDRLVRVLATVEARRGIVVVGGDWNVDYAADRRIRSRPFPYAHLSPGMTNQHAPEFGRDAPTYGSRRVDSVWISESPRIRILDSSTIKGTFSDHSFARVRLRIR